MCGVGVRKRREGVARAEFPDGLGGSLSATLARSVARRLQHPPRAQGRGRGVPASSGVRPYLLGGEVGLGCGDRRRRRTHRGGSRPRGECNARLARQKCRQNSRAACGGWMVSTRRRPSWRASGCPRHPGTGAGCRRWRPMCGGSRPPRCRPPSCPLRLYSPHPREGVRARYALRCSAALGNRAAPAGSIGGISRGFERRRIGRDTANPQQALKQNLEKRSAWWYKWWARVCAVEVLMLGDRCALTRAHEERWDLGPRVAMWPVRLWDGNPGAGGRNARNSGFIHGP